MHRTELKTLSAPGGQSNNELDRSTSAQTAMSKTWVKNGVVQVCRDPFKNTHKSDKEH